VGESKVLGEGHGDNIATAVDDSLDDSVGDLKCLAHSNTNMAFLVPHHHHSSERHVLPSLHHLCHSPDLFFLEKRKFISTNRKTPPLVAQRSCFIFSMKVRGAVQKVSSIKYRINKKQDNWIRYNHGACVFCSSFFFLSMKNFLSQGFTAYNLFSNYLLSIISGTYIRQNTDYLR
jgi:hypothetical protein